MDEPGLGDVFRFEGFRFDRAGGCLYRINGSDVSEFAPLGSRALALLAYLVERQGKLVSKDEIMKAVWHGGAVEEANLTVQISALRRVLDRDREQGSCIQTISGRGYRFVSAVQHTTAPSAAAVASTPGIGAPGQLDSGGPHVLRPPGVSAAVTAPSPPTPKAAPRLSIVVLPLANLSSDPEQEYFVDAITNVLTTDLSRIVNSSVISRTTAFTYKGKSIDVRHLGRDLGVRYVLEGSVRRLGEQVQVSVQLIDAESGSHVWSDRFDTDRTNLAKAQSEITFRLAQTLKLELIEAVGRRIDEEGPVNLDANDLVMRGWFLFYRPVSADNLQQAQAAFEQALAINPKSFDARVGVATTLNERLALRWSRSVEQDMARSDQSLSEAFARNRNDSWALSELGRLRRLQGRLLEAQIEFEKAIQRDPNNVRAVLQTGITLLFLGRPEAALLYVEKTLRLNPSDQNLFYRYFWLGFCHLLIGDPDQAIDALTKARAANPQLDGTHVLLAAAFGLRGDLDEARTSLAEWIKFKPETNSIERLRAGLGADLRHPQFLALFEKTVEPGLRRSGMAER